MSCLGGCVGVSQETGWAHPAIKEGPGDGQAQDQQRPGHLVSAAHTWPADQIPDGLDHKHVLDGSEDHNERGKSQGLEVHRFSPIAAFASNVRHMTCYFSVIGVVVKRDCTFGADLPGKTAFL